MKEAKQEGNSLMNTLKEKKGKKYSTETSQQEIKTEEQVYSVLQSLDLLPSRCDQAIFKRIYWLFSLFLVYEVVFALCILGILPASLKTVEFRVELCAFSIALFVSVLLSFKAWRKSAPKMLRDLFEKKRISIPSDDISDDVNKSYLSFLERYRNELASQKRFFFSLIPIGFLLAFNIWLVIQALLVKPLSYYPPLVVLGYLFSVLLYGGGMYCVGTVVWSVYVSWRYVRKLTKEFEFKIQPFHTDKCGGLKLLGDFCFGSVSPISIGSGLLIGFIIIALLEYVHGTYGVESSIAFLVLNVYFPLFLLLLIIPLIIFVFIPPLRSIHTKMVSQRETKEDTYNIRIEALREEIQSLLDSDKVEEAKALQEKKELEEKLYAPYPRWPFRFRSEISSTVVGVIGSLFFGVMTAVLQQYFLPAVITLLFHKP